MINLPRCIAQGGLQVLRFQIGEIGQDLLAALPSGKERKDVLHTDPHTADAGPAATLIGVVGDALAPTDQDRYQRQPLMDLDIAGPDGLALAGAHEPLLSAIAAAAANTDRHGVPRRWFDAMAAAGLLGSPLTPPALQDRWLEPVACGQALAGVAFAHLRRAGAPNPLDGRLDWITSWDIADLVLLCLRCVDGTELADGQVLFVEDFSIWSDACGRPASCWCRPKRLTRAEHPSICCSTPPSTSTVTSSQGGDDNYARIACWSVASARPRAAMAVRGAPGTLGAI
jgi:hypothetical protein